MRTNRLLFIILFILSVVGISFTGGPVSYGFFFFMLIIPVVAFIYSLILFWRFKIFQKVETKAVTALSPADFYFTLQNEDFFAHSGIKIELFSDFSTITGIDTGTEYELMPHSGVSKEAKLVCRYRGEYEVGIKNVTVTDYLKLFPITFKNRETLKVSVMPRLEILDDIAYLDELCISSKDSYTNLSEPDVLVREYVPGDDIRSINWKITAKTGAPMVRKRIGEHTPGIDMIMDSCRYSSNPRDYLPLENKILELVLAVTYYYLDRRIPVTVHAHGYDQVKYALDGVDTFEDFYQSVSGFGFLAGSTQEVCFNKLCTDEMIWQANAVIMVLHEWSIATAEFAGQMDKIMIPVMVYLITDDQMSIPDREIYQHVTFKVIGCEDRLQEVLNGGVPV